MLKKVSKITLLTLGSLTFLGSAYATQLSSQPAPDSVMRPMTYKQEASVYVLDSALENSLKAKTLYGITLRDHAGLKEFYKDNHLHPLWVQEGEGLNEKGEKILSALKGSWIHGFNPDRYHVSHIEKLTRTADPADLATLELMMSDAVARFGHDMKGMRVSARAIGQKNKYWQKNLSTYEVLTRFKTVSASQVDGALEDLEPDNKLYRVLKKELVKLLAKREETSEAFSVVPLRLDGILRPGDSHRFIKKLRIRMGVKGPIYLYDDELALSVMNFQAERGLKRDGIIGPDTLAELNKTAKDRIDQIIANMERLRWVDTNKPDKYIVVNIPATLLWAIDKGKVQFQMPVIVGRKGRQTKSFKVDVTGVRFNPTWTVPVGIKHSDYVPKLRKDPTYLTDKGIEFLQGYGPNAITLDPTTLDWNTMSRAEMNKIRMVQRPGDNNALGRVRILMPNIYNMYLHDTNKPAYFKEEVRFLSSGCVRLSDPEKLARFVLSDNKDWSDKKMQDYLDKGEMVDIEADKTFPVYILYQTIWMHENGDLVYAPDVYGRDKKMIEALKKQGDYYVPDMSSEGLIVNSSKTELATHPINK